MQNHSHGWDIQDLPWAILSVFSIHGLINEHVVPLVFALLSDKCATTYYKLFSVLRDAMFSVYVRFDF